MKLGSMLARLVNVLCKVSSYRLKVSARGSLWGAQQTVKLFGGR